MTGNDIMNEALLLIKRLQVGQTAAAVEIATTQLALNYLIDAFNAEGSLVYSVAPVTFNVTIGTASYILGSGGSYATRPVKVTAWNFRSTSGQANGGAPVDAETFAKLAEDRGATGSRVKMLNYDEGYPTGSVHLYPIPNNAGTLELWIWSQLAQIADFTATLAWPPAYLKAIVFNLAVQMAGKFTMPLDPAVASEAAQARAAVMAASSAAVAPQQAQRPA